MVNNDESAPSKKGHVDTNLRCIEPRVPIQEGLHQINEKVYSLAELPIVTSETCGSCGTKNIINQVDADALVGLHREILSNCKEAYSMVLETHNKLIVEIEQGYQEALKKNLDCLDKAIESYENTNERIAEIRGKKIISDKERQKLEKIEAALNSYSIVSVEPSDRLSCQVGILYEAVHSDIVSPLEFNILMSFRAKQALEYIRPPEQESETSDLLCNTDQLGKEVHHMLIASDMSVPYSLALGNFKERIADIEAELHKEFFRELSEKKEEEWFEQWEQWHLKEWPQFEGPVQLVEDEDQLEDQLETLKSVTEPKHSAIFYPLYTEECLIIQGLLSSGKGLRLDTGENINDLINLAKLASCQPKPDKLEAIQFCNDVEEKISGVRRDLINKNGSYKSCNDGEYAARQAISYIQGAIKNIQKTFASVKDSEHACKEAPSDLFFKRYRAAIFSYSNAILNQANHKVEAVCGPKKAGQLERDIVRPTVQKQHDLFISRQEQLMQNTLEAREKGFDLRIGLDPTVSDCGTSHEVIRGLRHYFKDKTPADIRNLLSTIGTKDCKEPILHDDSPMRCLHQKQLPLMYHREKHFDEVVKGYLQNQLSTHEPNSANFSRAFSELLCMSKEKAIEFQVEQLFQKTKISPSGERKEARPCKDEGKKSENGLEIERARYKVREDLDEFKEATQRKQAEEEAKKQKEEAKKREKMAKIQEEMAIKQQEKEKAKREKEQKEKERKEAKKQEKEQKEKERKEAKKREKEQEEKEQKEDERIEKEQKKTKLSWFSLR